MDKQIIFSEMQQHEFLTSVMSTEFTFSIFFCSIFFYSFSSSDALIYIIIELVRNTQNLIFFSPQYCH